MGCSTDINIITRVEYNKALDVVEAYRRQVFNALYQPLVKTLKEL
jgi:hypothetical protein